MQISEVTRDKEIFRPAAGEQIKIGWRLSSRAKVSLKIYDCDQDLVAALSPEKIMAAGRHTLVWKGKDQHGRVVPNEAYFFIIEATAGANHAVYDPREVSGGMFHEIDRVKLLAASQQLEYELPETGRVSVRAGLVDGPLLAIPVDWEPRTKGVQRERWDGMDQEKLIQVGKRPDYRIRASYYTLPENTIITRGNKQVTFLDYKQAQTGAGPPKTWELPQLPASVLRSPLASKGIIFAKAPPLEVTFPGAPGDDKHPSLLPQGFQVRVDLPEPWKSALKAQPYEIYYFWDGKFLIENPNIRLPYETTLSLKEYQPGLHVLTVNLIDIGGQIGIRSTAVRIR
ncbi:MAG: hypothetical protein L6277_13860 [Desulfobacterales bacterium]|nr:hypothetical protein [Pseudomonadota bacterium]MCG2773158.1 hypothetical protein [Desulfobacterales bacterium]